jgi:hypothetical protein
MLRWELVGDGDGFEGMKLRINVKDRVAYHNHPEFGPLIRQLDEVDPGHSEGLYADVVEDFWEIAADLAFENGFGHDAVTQEGRSGGWLVIRFEVPLSIDAHEFVGHIESTMHAAREMFLSRLQDAVDDLEKKRERNTVRSEN